MKLFTRLKAHKDYVLIATASAALTILLIQVPWTRRLTIMLIVIGIFFHEWRLGIFSKCWICVADKEKISLDDEWKVIHKLRLITPQKFEQFIAKMLVWSGYTLVSTAKRTKRNKPLPDWWIDIIACKGNKTLFFQIKKNWTSLVSEWVIKQLIYDTKNVLWKNDKSAIATTSLLSHDAKLLAEDNAIKIIHYRKLLDRIHEIAKDDHVKKEIESFLTNTRNSNRKKFIQNVRTCPKCYAPLQIRRNKRTKKKFYGCRNYYRTDKNDQKICTYTHNLESKFWLKLNEYLKKLFTSYEREA